MGDGVNLSFSEAVYMLQHKRETPNVVLYSSSMTARQHKNTNRKELSYFLELPLGLTGWLLIFIRFKSGLFFLDQHKTSDIIATSILFSASQHILHEVQHLPPRSKTYICSSSFLKAI